jgi:hypothetical protein
VIAGASTHVALKLVPDRFAVEIRLTPDHVDGGHNHARRAEAALQTMIFPESLLDWVQLPILGEPLDRYYSRTFGLNSEHAAGFDRLAVDMDHASSTLAGVTADVRAGQPKLLPQEINEQGAVFGFG